MNYKYLGKSGLKISEICLGTNNFGGQVNEKESVKIIMKTIDLGINVIDTANTYTKGRSEKIIGKTVQDYRDDVILATKVGYNVGEGPNQSGLSRKHILSQFKKSLENLKTDFIDIYYLHRPDPDTPMEETLRTVNDLVRNGEVRYLACSNFSKIQMVEAYEICERYDLEKFVAVQPPYNLLRREIEKELLPFCQQKELGVLSYTPLMGGFLTGKYLEKNRVPKDSRAEYNRKYWERVNKTEHFTLLEEIRNIANDLGVSLTELAIAWILKNPIITAPIIGASTQEQIEENCSIAEIMISDEIYEKLNEITKS
jgi:aryl-alcohol dehydrogenase-like predicted oxidoreductase